MGHAVAALTAMSRQVQKKPLFIPLFGVLAGVLGAVNALLAQIPLVGWIASGVLLGPAIQAGLVAMAAAMYERAEFALDVFAPSVEEHWVSLVGAQLNSIVAFLVLAFVVVIVALLGTGLSAGVTEAVATGPSVVTGAVGVTSILLFLFVAAVALVFYAVFQFIGVAVVLNSAGAVDAVRQSIRVCVSKPVSVLGYSLLNPLVVSLPVILLAAPLGAIGLFVDGSQPGAVTAVLAGLGGAIGYVVGSALSSVYHVSFFSRVSSVLNLDGDSTPIVQNG